MFGSASIKHADVVASAISKLGGNPVWSLESFPEQLDITDIFREQIEKEKLALQLHQQNVRSEKTINRSLMFHGRGIQFFYNFVSKVTGSSY